MKELIASLSNQIRDAISIGREAKFKATQKEIRAIIVCGLGGSGIGGKIISLLLLDELKIPFLTTNDYTIPACIDEHTLVIASSYSGNTEETLYAVREAEKRKAEIAVITSGGELLEMAKSKGWNYVLVPGGEQPRAMLAYSLVQQLYLLNKYGLISATETDFLNAVPNFLDAGEAGTQTEAKRIADFIHKKTTVIYSGSSFEGVAVRFRQQLNENAKELCWHHVFPEMTHNELVGWAGGSDKFAVLFFNTDYDHPRTGYRWSICKDLISKQTSSVMEIKALGGNKLSQNFYLIHLTDWVSFFLAENKSVDPVEVNVIGLLKSEMAKKK
jgi:glucose/mannose-6-phosphate isomerase